MKKNIIVFVIGMFLVAVLFNILLNTDKELSKEAPVKEVQKVEKTTTETSQALGSEILTAQVKKLATNISSKLSDDSFFRSMNDYRVSVPTLIKNSNSKDLESYTVNLSNELNACLKKDYCGTTPDADGYFDENQTPGHKLLARSLEILNNLEEPNTDDLSLEEFLDYSNEKILDETSKLFLKSNPSQEEVVSFLNKANSLDGDFKSAVFLGLLDSDLDKSLIITELSKQLKEADNYSVVSFFQKLSRVELSDDELTEVAKSGCHLKESEISWNSFKHHLNKYSQKMGYSLRASQLCL